MTAAPGLCPTVACSERHQRLLEEFAHLLDEYHRMQRTQLAAVLEGEDFLFEEWIAKAAVRMVQAKHAVIAYREQHG
jgi:hypothetical protein